MSSRKIVPHSTVGQEIWIGLYGDRLFVSQGEVFGEIVGDFEFVQIPKLKLTFEHVEIRAWISESDWQQGFLDRKTAQQFQFKPQKWIEAHGSDDMKKALELLLDRRHQA